MRAYTFVRWNGRRRRKRTESSREHSDDEELELHLSRYLVSCVDRLASRSMVFSSAHCAILYAAGENAHGHGLPCDGKGLRTADELRVVGRHAPDGIAF